jgi:hypothetical protein
MAYSLIGSGRRPGWVISIFARALLKNRNLKKSLAAERDARRKMERCALREKVEGREVKGELLERDGLMGTLTSSTTANLSLRKAIAKFWSS